MEDFWVQPKEMNFRKRLPEVVSKPLYAADSGNISVVSDKEKRGQRSL